jgi:hypothetical protein
MIKDSPKFLLWISIKKEGGSNNFMQKSQVSPKPDRNYMPKKPQIGDVDALVGSTSFDGSPTLGLGRVVSTKARSTIVVAAAGCSSSHAPQQSHH